MMGEVTAVATRATGPGAGGGGPRGTACEPRTGRGAALVVGHVLPEELEGVGHIERRLLAGEGVGAGLPPPVLEDAEDVHTGAVLLLPLAVLVLLPPLACVWVCACVRAWCGRGG